MTSALTEQSVLTAHDSAEAMARSAGGKGYNLHRLGRARSGEVPAAGTTTGPAAGEAAGTAAGTGTGPGFEVPVWAVIGCEVLNAFRLTAGLDERLDRALARLRSAGTGAGAPAVGDPAAASAAAAAAVETTETEAVAAEIAEAFLDAALDPVSEAAIRRAYEHVGGGPVAVRSSGADEDRAALSFAGQYDSFLNVTDLPGVLTAVRRCWASAYSARSLTYRRLHGLPLHPIEMAVVIQRMVPADASGVLFTADPTTGDHGTAVVSATYGLGEALVSGAEDADTVIFDRRDGTVRRQVIGEKRSRLDPAPDRSGTAARPVDPDRSAAPALGPDWLERLRRAADEIEALFGTPQDIEWAISGDRLWVVQSRPITGLRDTAAAGGVAAGGAAAGGAARPGGPRGVASPAATVTGATEATGTVTAGTGAADAAGGDLRVWDNSNIIESFGEVTAPLTFSFARHVYRRVYRDYCALLGVPRRDLARMDVWFGDMLGYFDGRVYYNVLNWYKVIRLLPGYRLNRRILAAAMGVRETDEALAQRQHPIEPLWRERLVRARVALRFGRMFFTVRGTVARFNDHFRQVHAEFDAVDYSGMRGDEIDRRLHELEDRLLAEWGGTAVLDNVIMLSYGILHTLTERWLPEAPGWFLWEAVRAGDSGDVESTEPARRLTALAAELARRPALAEQVRAHDPALLWDWLHSNEGGDPTGSGGPGGGATGGLGADVRWLLGELRAYLADYGYRSANELKLEEPDLHDDPSLLASMLQDALAGTGNAPAPAPAAPNGSAPETAGGGAAAGAPQPETGGTADAYLDEHLRGPRRWFYERVRGRLRLALRERERVRFARTRAFGMARRMLKAIGEDMERVGALGDRRDVFYLRLEEIRAAYAGTLNHRELRPLAELRRDQQIEQRRMIPPPPRFITRGGPYWGVTTADPEEPSGAAGQGGDATADGTATGTAKGTGTRTGTTTGGGAETSAAGVLRGTPCGPGIATAQARVVDEPRDVAGNIVVTYRTDPGWVGVLPSASALLIERGSPLTHVAIVARELGVPTVVQIPGLTERVRTGMTLTVDGGTGVVEIHDNDE